MTTGLTWLIGNQRRHTLPPGWTGLRGPRSTRWFWELLDTSDRSLGRLGGVDSGSLDWNVNREIRTGGNLSWSGWVADVPAWRDLRVRPWYHADFPDGSMVEWPMGVYLPATPNRKHTGSRVDVPVDLYDKTLVLVRDQLDATEALPVGTHIASTVEAIINASAGGPVIVEDSTEVLRSQMVWTPGVSRLRQVNDLLAAGGYFSVYTDGMGIFRGDRYVSPAARPPVWQFHDERNRTFMDGFEIEEDDFEAVNKVVLISRTDDEDATALRSVATIDGVYGPSHKLSHESRGFWITRTEEGVEATSQGVLDGMARRFLAESVEQSATLQLGHFPVPVTLNSRVDLTRTVAGVQMAGVVQTMTIPCSATGDWSSTIRRVAA